MLGQIVARLRLHAAKKNAGGDPFFDSLQRFTTAQLQQFEVDSLIGRPLSTSDRLLARELIVKLLLVLSVRSELLLALFGSNDISVASPACLPQIYEACLRNGSAFPGLRPERERNFHTTEQKLWGMGRLVDSILFKFWQDPACFDQLLVSPGEGWK
jgi:hypothetical protein